MTATGRVAVFEPPVLYGRDYDDLDRWADQTGVVYAGLGPFQRRWARRLRRQLRPHSVGWLR